MILPALAWSEDEEAVPKDFVLTDDQTIFINSERKPSKGKNKPDNNAEFKVKLWSDRKNNTFAVGENVRIYVQPNKDANILVMSQGASGNIVQIFPNQFQPNPIVRANQKLPIPDTTSTVQLTVSPPTGVEVIKVIASTNLQQSVLPPNATVILSSASPYPNFRLTSKDLNLTLQSPTPQPSGGAYPYHQQAGYTTPQQDYAYGEEDFPSLVIHTRMRR